MASKRRQRITKLIVGEGDSDVVFLNHIKSLYSYRDSPINVKVKPGFGGSPSDVVKRTFNLFHQGAYDAVFVLIDGDCPLDINHVKREKRKIELRCGRKIPFPVILISDPCLEGLLCEILNVPQKERSITKKAQKVLQEKFGCPKTLTREYCEGALSKHVLSEARKRCALLDRIILIFTSDRPN